VADEAGSAVVLGTFQPAVAIALDASPRSIAVADFNDDGKPDLAIGQFDVSTTSGDVSISAWEGRRDLPIACEFCSNRRHPVGFGGWRF
jgi:hypothetical protein